MLPDTIQDQLQLVTRCPPGGLMIIVPIAAVESSGG